MPSERPSACLRVHDAWGVGAERSALHNLYRRWLNPSAVCSKACSHRGHPRRIAGVRLFRALQAMLPGSAGGAAQAAAALAPAEDPAAAGGALAEGPPGSGSALGAEVPMELAAAAAAAGAAPVPEVDPSPNPAPRERAPPRRVTRGRAPRGPPAGAP